MTEPHPAQSTSSKYLAIAAAALKPVQWFSLQRFTLNSLSFSAHKGYSLGAAAPDENLRRRYQILQY